MTQKTQKQSVCWLHILYIFGVGLAISFALLALTHLPTFVIFFPVPVGYALFIASRNQWKIVSVRLSLAIIIAIGLSAIYWFPAMTTQESISMDAILNGGFDYANNFLFTGPKIGHSKNFWRRLELLTVLLQIIYLAAIVFVLTIIQKKTLLSPPEFGDERGRNKSTLSQTDLGSISRKTLHF